MDHLHEHDHEHPHSDENAADELDQAAQYEHAHHHHLSHHHSPEEKKRQYRDEHWEEDLQKAFDAGKRMAESIG